MVLGLYQPATIPLRQPQNGRSQPLTAIRLKHLSNSYFSTVIITMNYNVHAEFETMAYALSSPSFTTSRQHMSSVEMQALSQWTQHTTSS